MESGFKSLAWFMVSLLSFLSFNSVCATGAQRGSPGIKLNGRAVSFDTTQPFIEEGRIFIPIRSVFSSLGADISWDDSVKTATIQYNNKKIILKVNSNIAHVNDEAQKLDANAKNQNGRVFIPLRFVSENLGAKISWDERTKTANIKDIGLLEQTYAGIRIKGDKKFIENTILAIDLTIKSAPEYFDWMKENLTLLVQEENSMTAPNEHPPCAYIGNPTSDASTTWYASILAHDTYHAKLYNDMKGKSGLVPDRAWTGFDAEMKALNQQINFLRKVKAPSKEIEYSESLKGKKWWEDGVSW